MRGCKPAKQKWAENLQISNYWRKVEDHSAIIENGTTKNNKDMNCCRSRNMYFLPSEGLRFVIHLRFVFEENHAMERGLKALRPAAELQYNNL